MENELQFLDYEGLTTFKNSLNGVDIVTTDGDGNAYTATIPGITELKAGMSFMIIPHTVSTETVPTLNVNGLGAKSIRRRLSNSTVSTAAGTTASWIAANKPVRMLYDGTFWIAELDIPNAADLYGAVAVEHGGTGATTVEGARANLSAQEQHKSVTVTLNASSWSSKEQTVTCNGVTTGNTVIVGAHPSHYANYLKANVRCTAQGANSLTFTCDTVPTADLQANVLILT